MVQPVNPVRSGPVCRASPGQTGAAIRPYDHGWPVPLRAARWGTSEPAVHLVQPTRSHIVHLGGTRPPGRGQPWRRTRHDGTIHPWGPSTLTLESHRDLDEIVGAAQRPTAQSSTVGRHRERSADLSHPRVAEATESLDEQPDRDRFDGVEVHRASVLHRVVCRLEHDLTGEPRMVVVQGATRARRSRGIAASRDSTTTGRRPISGGSHHHTSPRRGRSVIARPLHGTTRDRPTRLTRRWDVPRRPLRRPHRSRQPGREPGVPPTPRR